MRRVRASRHSLTGGRPKAGGYLSSCVLIYGEGTILCWNNLWAKSTASSIRRWDAGAVVEADRPMSLPNQVLSNRF